MNKNWNIDVNECLREKICGKREFCQNTVGSYTCYECDPACLTCDGFGVDKCQECNVGYKLNSDSNKCEDIDECQQDPKRCGENKKCVNKAGSFECIGNIIFLLKIIFILILAKLNH